MSILAAAAVPPYAPLAMQLEALSDRLSATSKGTARPTDRSSRRLASLQPEPSEAPQAPQPSDTRALGKRPCPPVAPPKRRRREAGSPELAAAGREEMLGPFLGVILNRGDHIWALCVACGPRCVIPHRLL